MTQTLIQAIAGTLQARANCAERDNDGKGPVNPEWYAKHTDRLSELAKDHLPSGSGIDCGTTIDVDASKPNRVVLNLSYHHMNEGGMYDGWTEHSVIVTPDLLSGFTLRITGRNRNDIKEYLYQVYDVVLRESVD